MNPEEMQYTANSNNLGELKQITPDITQKPKREDRRPPRQRHQPKQRRQRGRTRTPPRPQ